MAYTVEVIRSSRKSLSLKLRPDGTVVVRAPMRTGTPQIRAFVDGTGTGSKAGSADRRGHSRS